MKKYFVSIILCLITGVIMAKIMFNQYDETKATSIPLEKAYFFQVGVFSNEENMNNEASKYDSYIYILDEDKYYVYIGITSSNKDKLQSYFDNLGYTTYVKEIEIDNEFAAALKDYDIRLSSTDNNEDIKNINNEILKRYEEMSHDEN